MVTVTRLTYLAVHYVIITRRAHAQNYVLFSILHVQHVPQLAHDKHQYPVEFQLQSTVATDTSDRTLPLQVVSVSISLFVFLMTIILNVVRFT